MEEIAQNNLAIKKALTIEEIFRQIDLERRLYDLREKAIRDEISSREGARQEGLDEGKNVGERETLRKSINTFLNIRFAATSLELQKKVNKITDIGILNDILSKIFAANSQEDAKRIISNK